MCGILAYFGNTPFKINDFVTKLYMLKHRGQDSCGIRFINKNKSYTHIEKNFDKLKENTFNVDESKNIIGHVRYATSGKNMPILQPFISKNAYGEYSLIFNGNIPLNKYNNYKHFSSDTLAIIDFLNKKSLDNRNWIELLTCFLDYFERSYSLIIVNSKRQVWCKTTFICSNE